MIIPMKEFFVDNVFRFVQYIFETIPLLYHYYMCILYKYTLRYLITFNKHLTSNTDFSNGCRKVPAVTFCAPARFKPDVT